jgi:hypothetical protein
MVSVVSGATCKQSARKRLAKARRGAGLQAGSVRSVIAAASLKHRCFGGKGRVTISVRNVIAAASLKRRALDR